MTDKPTADPNRSLRFSVPTAFEDGAAKLMSQAFDRERELERANELGITFERFEVVIEGDLFCLYGHRRTNP